ncbi:hypothetical protein TNCV_3274841 [Trichonephila clavipes]|uniref:Uncharacterized protein n=1 Tax=Trichonephila clavipes TaxID=2585209 RepID=A0A8X6SRS0_TRICX|nr:hypothetical protein TNCV_3274841 [Trichonephila clavipes]
MLVDRVKNLQQLLKTRVVAQVTPAKERLAQPLEDSCSFCSRQQLFSPRDRLLNRQASRILKISCATQKKKASGLRFGERGGQATSDPFCRICVIQQVINPDGKMHKPHLSP